MTRYNELLNGIKETIQAEAALSQSTNKKLVQQTKSAMPFRLGDKVMNINSACMHYGSKGSVCGLEELPGSMGEIVAYKTTNAGPNWKMGDILKKTPDQLTFDMGSDDDDEMEDDMEEEMKDEKEDEEIMSNDEMDDESEDEESEYKQEFFEMSVGSLRAIMKHSQQILESLDNPMVKENLTESWLQGKIAITEDYMRTIHDFIMFVSESDDTISAADKPGLWDNIRKKRERMGKKYKPAKPGDEGRPDPKQWKRLTDGK